MTTYTLRQGSPERTRADAVVVGVTRSGKAPVVAAGGDAVAQAYGRRFAPLLAQLGLTGAAGEVARVPTDGRLNASTLVLVGLGPDATPDRLRAAAGVAARNLGNAASVALALPATTPAEIAAVVQGFWSGGYAYVGQRSGARRERVAEVAVLSDAARRKECVAALERAVVIGEQGDRVRDWVSTPPNLLSPVGFADAVAAIDTRRKAPVQVTVHDETELAEMGCGGILAVGAASQDPPRLVRLEYRPRGATRHVALVGKGITYDSGGLTLKRASPSMALMKNDMAGAAAVVGATYALAALDVPVSVTAWLPMAENMVSAESMRPGDVLTMYGGRTVEVRNTDAEGRLVLADALAMAAGSDADLVVEISTLTGPCVAALGDRIAGLFGDDETVARVQRAAETAGELVWPLPLTPDFRERVRTESPVADLLQHNWVRAGSPSWAAAFLAEFVGDKPFAHLDVAGPAWNSGGPWGDVPAGATAFGLTTLVQVVLDHAAAASG